jgi:LPS export ABC transporter protein LptC
MKFIFCLLIIMLSASCTFDYGQNESSGDDMPDLIMENVKYVRVRSSDPKVRFQAERAERYEKKGIMELSNFTFEQFGDHGNDVNAAGWVASASVEIDSGNISMDGGVRIEVESEDIAIETTRLEWKDEERTLFSGEEDEVNIYQTNGTKFTGVGFHAYARSHSWEFTNGAVGIYISDDDEETEETEEAKEPKKSVVSGEAKEAEEPKETEEVIETEEVKEVEETKEADKDIEAEETEETDEVIPAEEK